MALCSLSTGSTCTPLSRALRITISPAITRISLLATARSLPASIAASAGRNPPVPTIATSTISAFVKQAISRSPSCPAKIRGLYASARWRASIFVSSTRQIDCARVSFAAAASFSTLLLAASPTISIRSGISRATFSALSPIDPVAPRITTRLRTPGFSVLIKRQRADHANSREKTASSFSFFYSRLFASFAGKLLPVGVEGCSFVVTLRVLSRYPNYQPQIEKQERRGEKQTIQKIECATDSRQQIPRILYISAALDD